VGLFALGAVSPWILMTDPEKFGRSIDRVQSLEIKTIASCHSPVIEGPHIERAFNRIRELPMAEAPALPDQAVLEQIVAAISQHG
jgi:hypothetical protein